MVFYIDAGLQKTVRNRVDFVLTNLPTFDAHSGIATNVLDIDVRMAELTSFFTVFSFNVAIQDITFAASLDAALAAGNKDFCLIQNPGHIFYGYDQLSFDMNATLDQCEFMTGHIMDRGGYFYLHDQCLLVNRRAWEKLGKPKFGQPEVGQKEVALPHRSAENVHDNYTPLFLEPTGKQITVNAKLGYGWNAISAGLNGGLKVLNWPQAIRKAKRHCYAYYGDTKEWIKALADVTAAPATQDAQLERILNFLRNTPDKVGADKKVFVFNSEGDADIPNLKYSKGVDRAFVLASGFKANRLLESVGFHGGTEVVTYDYSAPALALRQRAIETWDGRDYGAFFLGAQADIAKQFGQVIYLPAPLLKDAASINAEFQREMGSVFTSAEHWLAHWQKFKTLKHSFVEVDVLRDHDGVEAMLETHAKGNAVLWLSDMFNSPNAIGKFDWYRRKKAFAVVTDTLAAKTESYLILGGEPRLWLRG
jgi:hypothetical protein